MDYVGTKRCVVVCTMKLLKKKKVSAVLLHVTLHVNWWDNASLKVLDVFQMDRILVAAPYWIRFAIHCFDGCEWIASRLSITKYDHILQFSLINANAMFPMICSASRKHNLLTFINTTNYKSNQIRSGNWSHCHL